MVNPFRTIGIVLGFLLIASVSAEAMPPGNLALTFSSSVDGSTQPYRVYVPEVPDASGPLPLLVVLHGKGGNENTWFEYTPIEEAAQEYGYLVAAPSGRGDYFYRGPAEQDVLDIIDEVKRLCPVDAKRVYLMGHSMGGWGTWWIGLRHPDLFATICPMAPLVPYDLLPNALHLDPLIFHSDDDPVLPVEYSRRSARRLKDLGIQFTYIEEQGYGHSSKMIGNNLPRIFDWFAKHSLIENPDTVKLVANSPRAGKAYWLKILETAEFPEYATIEAEWKTPDSLTIVTENVRRFAVDLRTRGIECEDVKVQMDGEPLSVEKAGNWLVFENEDGWTYDTTDEDPEAWKSPRLVAVKTAVVSSDSSRWFYRHLGTLIRQEADADVAVFSADMFQREIPVGPLTGEDVLDLYVYPNEALATFALTGQELVQMLGTEPQVGCGWWGELHMDHDLDPEPEKTYTIVSPQTVAKNFTIEMEILPKTIGEMLVQAMERKRSQGK